MYLSRKSMLSMGRSLMEGAKAMSEPIGIWGNEDKTP